MSRQLLTIAWLLAALAIGRNAWCVDQASDPDALVHQLGLPAYAQRVAARHELQSAGLQAFDAIWAGKSSLDPEIADACERLLEELTRDLSHRHDSTPVREWLRASHEAPLEAIAGLANEALPNEAAGLARIARFAPSEFVSAQAASTLLAHEGFRLRESREQQIAESITKLVAEHGPGERPAAQWLHAVIERSESSETLADTWRRHATAALLCYDNDPSSLSLEVVATLHWRWLRAALLAADDGAADEAIDLLVQLNPEQAVERFARAARWTAEAERWQLVDRLARRHAERLTGKRGLYLAADLAKRRGDTDRAQELAEKALAASPDEEDLSAAQVILGPRVALASELYESGLSDWAIAEYQAAAQTDDPLDGKAGYAAWRLAMLLFDQARYEQAAETLEPIATAIARSRSKRRSYGELPQADRGYLPSAGELISRYRFCEALAARDRGDTQAEIASLRRAIVANSQDADVLIAMYRVEEAPEDFAADARRRMEAMQRDREQEIWENPTDPASFNEWAWLVSNTEGDFEKAIRYSRRSLQLEPETAGYLDTLARCLFSAGRVSEALVAQRRAVELEPRMQVLRRQLQEFEAANQQDAEGE